MIPVWGLWLSNKNINQILYMEKHTIRLIAVIGLSWLCFLAVYVDQTSTARISSAAQSGRLRPVEAPSSGLLQGGTLTGIKT